VQTDVTTKSAETEITATTLVGYWMHRSDGLNVHITGLEFDTFGAGSFKDINGKIIPEGKFRNIKYLGNNKWECQQYLHSPSLRYPQDTTEIIWQDAIIEMLDLRTIKVGNNYYDRI
jgi:hypothetical protein